MADHSDDILIREVDEELRQEQFQKVWSRYGKIIIAAAVLIVASVAGYQFWRSQDLQGREALGDRFAQAQRMAIQGDNDGARRMFESLASEKGGYGLLARFQEAGLRGAQGDTAGALAIYDAIAANPDTNETYRGLAAVLAAGLEINGDGDGSTIRNRLGLVTAPGNPWRFTAQELLAALDLKEGDRDAARAAYQALVEDSATPETLRQRATEMLTILR